MDVIIESFIETIQTTTGVVPIQTSSGITHGYCSKISTSEANFFFYSDLEFLHFLSNAILFESNPQKEDLYDLCNEVANLVIGRAKVLYSQKNIQTTLSTPSFLGEMSSTPTHLEGIHFAIERGKCSIYKENL